MKKEILAGIDEAGRGALAGPVVAAAVIFRGKFSHPDLRDSKKLTSRKRAELFEIIIKDCDTGIGESSAKEIDELGIREANFLAMRRAIDNLKLKPNLLQIDGRDNYPFELPHEFIIKGDDKIPQISVASIVAKHWRDQLMIKLASQYSDYQLDQHKGYGTKMHMKMIEKFGPCSIHRQSWEPFRPKLF